MVRALELTARLGIDDPGGAWRWWNFGNHGEIVTPADWERLGLPSSLLLEGESLSRDVFAAGDGIDWGLEPEPGDYLAVDAVGLPLFHEVPAALRARGARLAQRVAEGAPRLWVLDPQRQWHLGPGAPNWSDPLPGTFGQWIQLSRPASVEDDWPWVVVPENADDVGRWSVPLPRGLDWDDRIVESTEHFCRAMAAAHRPLEVERAMGLGLMAMQAMNRAIGWMEEEFAVRDFTGRSPFTNESTVTWPKRRALDLREELRAFAAEVPKPAPPTCGHWSTLPGPEGGIYRG
jgi:hypothetical protein